VARVSPLTLRTSQLIRLRRLYPKAVYKEELGQLVLPLPRATNAVTAVQALLDVLVPAPAEVPA